MEEMVFPIIIERLVTINEIENNVKLLIFEILVCFNHKKFQFQENLY